jgi:ABC-type lipopolysaccharide export system ATPase subunit
MTWSGPERRASGGERRLVERRRTMRYNVQTLLIIEGITWVDPDDAERRRQVRRRADREALAIMFVRHARP